MYTISRTTPRQLATFIQKIDCTSYTTYAMGQIGELPTTTPHHVLHLVRICVNVE